MMECPQRRESIKDSTNSKIRPGNTYCILSDYSEVYELIQSVLPPYQNQNWFNHLSASFIQPCSRSDPELNQCIERVITAAGAKFTEGIPELGIAPLDPVQLGKIYVDNPSLKLTFTDTVVTGLKGFRVNTYKINLEKGKATLDFTANVTLKAHYVMNGQILILPIRGDGQSKIKITNLNIVVKYDFEDREDHWVVTGYKDHYKMDRAVFKFTNLFGGNKELARNTELFLNENWEIIMSEVAPPALKQIIRKCVEEVKRFYGAVPSSQLLRD